MGSIGKLSPLPPDNEDAARGVIVRVPLRERDPAVHHDRAVPVTPPIAALELRDLAPGRRVVHPEAPPSSFRVVYEEEAARDDGARPGVPGLPQPAQLT